MTNHLPLLTVSECRCYRSCPRKHHFRYRLGYRPIADAQSLTFGKLTHEGLAVWWQDYPEHCLDLTIKAMREHAAKVESQDPFALIMAEEMLIGYDARWRNEPLETLEVEREFDCELINPHTGRPSRTARLAGKMDAIARDPSGRDLVVEHKTSSSDISVGSDYWLKLQIDDQVSGYMIGAQSLGYNPVACLYDVLRKPLTKPSNIPIIDDGAKVVRDANGARVRTKDGKKWRETGDTALGYVLVTRPETEDEYRMRLRGIISAEPATYYQRGEVVRLETEEREALLDFWATARQIREGTLAKRWPRNPDACSQWGRQCEYWEACVGTASLEDPTRFRKAEQPHEELAAPAAA